MNSLIFYPWKSSSIGILLSLLSLALVLILYITEYKMSKSKKICAISFEKKSCYIEILIWNIVCFFTLLWFAAIPTSILAAVYRCKILKKDLSKIREMGLKGGWCLNEEYRKKQIEEFKLKTPEEQNKEIEYYKNFSEKLNPLLVITAFIIPIIIILILWVSGVGYRVQWTRNFVTL